MVMLINYCRKNSSTGMQCCPLVPMCLLVSSSENASVEIFAIGSLLAAVAVGFSAVIRDIPSSLCFSASVLGVLAFLVWIWRTAALGSGN